LEHGFIDQEPDVLGQAFGPLFPCSVMSCKMVFKSSGLLGWVILVFELDVFADTPTGNHSTSFSRVERPGPFGVRLRSAALGSPSLRLVPKGPGRRAERQFTETILHPLATKASRSPAVIFHFKVLSVCINKLPLLWFLQSHHGWNISSHDGCIAKFYHLF
jgi:hypothetical protein